MKPELFLKTSLQFASKRNLVALHQHLQGGLQTMRGDVVLMLENLLTHGADFIQDVIFEVLVSDGGVDLLPLLLKSFEVTHDEVRIEQHLASLSNHEAPEVLNLVDDLSSCLEPCATHALRRTHGKLKARFREFYYMTEFNKAEGTRLREVVNAMMKLPHPRYVKPLNEVLGKHHPQRCRQACRVLERLCDPSSLLVIPAAINGLLERRRKAESFGSLPLVHSSENLNLRCLLKQLIDNPTVPINKAELECWAQKLISSSSDLDQLIAYFDLGGDLLPVVRALFQHAVLASEKAPTAGKLSMVLKNWLADLNEALRYLILTGARLAIELDNKCFASEVLTLLGHSNQKQSPLAVWLIAAEGKELLLLEMMAGAEDDTILNILKALSELPIDTIPDSIIALANAPKRHLLRRAAIDLLAQSTAGPPLLQQLLVQGSMPVKEDVGSAIAHYQLTSCHDFMIDMLHDQSSDSLRLIILKSLEHFDCADTGLPVSTFLRSDHSLSIRLAALFTLFQAGGPHKLDLIIDSLHREKRIHQNEEVLITFLKNLSKMDLKDYESLILGKRAFISDLLLFPNAPVREATVAMLMRMSWEKTGHEGWLGTLQRALQASAPLRSEKELELLRALLTKISKCFALQREAESLHNRIGGIVHGLDHRSRMERLQALKQLDWIFRPEMIAGDPIGMKRLVSRIERVMARDEGDSLIEVLAIEIAGKIGHPSLRKKIKNYLYHPEKEVVSAALTALALPVNEVLLANMIKTIFHMDDSGYMTRLVCSILKKEEYDVVAANDPKLAIEMLRQAEFDLLILDLSMPAMHGLDFLKHIRWLNIAPRFTFLLTSVRSQESMLEAVKAGVDGVMLKPFSAEELILKIKELKNDFSS